MKRSARRYNLDPYYWHLWAAAQSRSLPDIGYPTQVPWYQPARLSKIEVLPDERPWSPPTVEDWRVVERLEAAVAEYRRRRPREVWCLEILEGAYRDAHPVFAQRCADAGVRQDTCRRLALRARNVIDAMIGSVNHLEEID